MPGNLTAQSGVYHKTRIHRPARYEFDPGPPASGDSLSGTSGWWSDSLAIREIWVFLLCSTSPCLHSHSRPPKKSLSWSTIQPMPTDPKPRGEGDLINSPPATWTLLAGCRQLSTFRFQCCTHCRDDPSLPLGPFLEITATFSSLPFLTITQQI